MARGAGGRGDVANSDNTELTAVDNISVFILPSIVNSVGQIGSRDRLGLHTLVSMGGKGAALCRAPSALLALSHILLVCMLKFWFWSMVMPRWGLALTCSIWLSFSDSPVNNLRSPWCHSDLTFISRWCHRGEITATSNQSLTWISRWHHSDKVTQPSYCYVTVTSQWWRYCDIKLKPHLDITMTSQWWGHTALILLCHCDITVVRSLRHQIDASPGYHDDITVLTSQSPHDVRSLWHQSEASPEYRHGVEYIQM